MCQLYPRFVAVYHESGGSRDHPISYKGGFMEDYLHFLKECHIPYIFEVQCKKLPFNKTTNAIWQLNATHLVKGQDLSAKKPNDELNKGGI
ncbi:hypothetical protein GOP47_0012422 [Adiantum capillus-veneris]|uniref:Uncharacterized protein n=1 Tax=Adiantum capillus-veneris TaxID=13818 RepID=A0A9D4URB5_ADICA|nr:hypothetical protein GOP47_0012422 [Adiantum capillus-veneris]